MAKRVKRQFTDEYIQKELEVYFATPRDMNRWGWDDFERAFWPSHRQAFQHEAPEIVRELMARLKYAKANGGKDLPPPKPKPAPEGGNEPLLIGELASCATGYLSEPLPEYLEGAEVVRAGGE